MGSPCLLGKRVHFLLMVSQLAIIAPIVKPKPLTNAAKAPVRLSTWMTAESQFRVKSKAANPVAGVAIFLMSLGIPMSQAPATTSPEVKVIAFPELTPTVVPFCVWTRWVRYEAVLYRFHHVQ